MILDCDHNERRTIRVALAHWRAWLAGAPGLTSTDEGRDEPRRIETLLAKTEGDAQ